MATEPGTTESDARPSPDAAPDVGTARTPELFAARLMEFLVVPAFVLDSNGAVMIWNKACERLTSTPACEVIGTKDHWKAFYDHKRPCLADLIIENRADEVGALYATAPSVQKNPNGLSAENWCVMPRIGRHLYVAIDVGAIYDEHGGLVAVVETLRDMTAQKLMEMELQELAGRDPLTGLANRRTFDHQLKEVFAKSLQTQCASHLILADIDYFKECNDRFGHPTGDRCLRTVAESVRRAGAVHLAARIGGDEFAVIVAYSPAGQPYVIAEQMREEFGRLTAELGDAASPVQCTLSLGLANCLDAASPEEWLATADAALYEAKKAGRNRVVAYDPPELKKTA